MSHSVPSLGVVDAEIVDEKPARPGAELELADRRVDIVGRVMPVVTTVRQHWSWTVAKFLFLAMTVDIWRGLVATHGVWWRWKILDTQTKRAAAEKGTGATEDRLQERRERRTVMSFVGAFVLAVVSLAFWKWAPPEWWSTVRWAGVGLAVLMFLVGHPWRRPADAPRDERPPGYDGSIDSVRAAFIGAKLAKAATRTVKGTSVWFAPGTKPEPVGEGIQLVLDLDSGITWKHVLAKKEEVSSGLAVDGDYMVVEKGRHSGQTKLWFAEDDPYRHGPVRSPLMDVERWDSWKSAPFGRTPHGFEIPLTVMYSNMLLGGSPGAGKGWTARNVAAPFVLDPEARLFIANGKSSGDWKPLQSICGDNYVMGVTAEAMERMSAMLDVLIEEMIRRNEDTERRGVSKIVPQDGYAPWFAVFDEVQWHTGCSLPSGIKQGRKELTWGEVVTEKLTMLVKGARSSGIVIALLTQKPGAKSIPTDLRDPVGTRFACRVGNSTTSEQVLGLTCKDGVDASKLPAKHRGIGILVPDAEVAGEITGYPVLRPYTIDDDDWALLGERGYRLRREAGTHGYLRLREDDAVALPELLQEIVDYVADFGADERVASTELREKLAPEMNATVFGRQLRKWGCPSGRDNGKQAMGPRVCDIRAAAQRIREGGSVDVLKSA